MKKYYFEATRRDTLSDLLYGSSSARWYSTLFEIIHILCMVRFYGTYLFTCRLKELCVKYLEKRSWIFLSRTQSLSISLSSSLSIIFFERRREKRWRVNIYNIYTRIIVRDRFQVDKNASSSTLWTSEHQARKELWGEREKMFLFHPWS